ADQVFGSDNFATQVQAQNNISLGVRGNAGMQSNLATTTSSPVALAADQWFNVFMVANNAGSGSFDIYLTADLDDATEAHRIANNFGFRNQTGGATIDHVFLANFSQNQDDFYVDNIFYSPGTSLVNPVPE